jgi:hypothetical protein
VSFAVWVGPDDVYLTSAGAKVEQVATVPDAPTTTSEAPATTVPEVVPVLTDPEMPTVPQTTTTTIIATTTTAPAPVANRQPQTNEVAAPETTTLSKVQTPPTTYPSDGVPGQACAKDGWTAPNRYGYGPGSVKCVGGVWAPILPPAPGVECELAGSRYFTPEGVEWLLCQNGIWETV